MRRLLFFFLLIAGAAALDAMERHTAFTLAIVRRDGVLMPFATYDGRHWKNSWPSPGETVDMPIGVAGIPKGWWHDKHPVMDWTLFPVGREGSEAATTSATRTVHVNGINWFRAGCQQGVGLRTDYKPAILPPSPRVHPYPKDALAFAGDVQISPIEIVPPTDKVAVALSAQLPAAVTPKEDQIVRGYTRDRWVHSYSESERARVPVDLEALYRVRQALEGRDLHYFEAVKRYFLPKSQSLERTRAPRAMKSQAAQPRCDLVTFVSGWFSTETDGSIRNLDPKVVVTSCDYRSVSFMLPMGTLRLDDKTLWVVQWSSPTFESYAIMEPKGETVQPLVEAPGGACAAERPEGGAPD